MVIESAAHFSEIIYFLNDSSEILQFLFLDKMLKRKSPSLMLILKIYTF